MLQDYALLCILDDISLYMLKGVETQIMVEMKGVKIGILHYVTEIKMFYQLTITITNCF